MATRILLYTQPGCLSCELMRVFLEAKEVSFEEHDISANPDDRAMMLEQLDSNETPTLVFLSGDVQEVVVGFDPERIDELLDGTPSSGSVAES